MLHRTARLTTAPLISALESIALNPLAPPNLHVTHHATSLATLPNVKELIAPKLNASVSVAYRANV